MFVSPLRATLLSAREVTAFDEAAPPEGATPWVAGVGPRAELRVVDADPGWAEVYEEIVELISGVLGEVALGLQHIGSTAVPGLAAKPIIDVDLTVADSGDESAYVPALRSAGFALVVREPWWYEHRCLRLTDPACNLHVFSPDSPEVERHRIFRDWLRAHPGERARYAAAKRIASRDTVAAGETVQEYNARKQALVRDIYGRAFRGLGLLDTSPT